MKTLATFCLYLHYPVWCLAGRGMLVTGDHKKIHTHTCCTKNRKQSIFLYLYGGENKSRKILQQMWYLNVELEVHQDFYRWTKWGEYSKQGQQFRQKKGKQVTWYLLAYPQSCHVTNHPNLSGTQHKISIFHSYSCRSTGIGRTEWV